jgi:hypothetical protein
LLIRSRTARWQIATFASAVASEASNLKRAVEAADTN